MLDLQLDEINVINRMDIDIHERRLRDEMDLFYATCLVPFSWCENSLKCFY
jgi:hypothetical protein